MLFFPKEKVVSGVSQDGFIDATVKSPVSLTIADDPEQLDALRAGDGLLEECSRPRLVVVIRRVVSAVGLRLGDLDREEAGLRHACEVALLRDYPGAADPRFAHQGRLMPPSISRAAPVR